MGTIEVGRKVLAANDLVAGSNKRVEPTAPDSAA